MFSIYGCVYVYKKKTGLHYNRSEITRIKYVVGSLIVRILYVCRSYYKLFSFTRKLYTYYIHIFHITAFNEKKCKFLI